MPDAVDSRGEQPPRSHVCCWVERFGFWEDILRAQRTQMLAGSLSATRRVHLRPRQPRPRWRTREEGVDRGSAPLRGGLPWSNLVGLTIQELTGKVALEKETTGTGLFASSSIRETNLLGQSQWSPDSPLRKNGQPFYFIFRCILQVGGSEDPKPSSTS